MLCILSCREFGARVINLKILMKSILPLFEHNDKNVRAEVRVYYIIAQTHVSLFFSTTDVGRRTGLLPKLLADPAIINISFTIS